MHKKIIFLLAILSCTPTLAFSQAEGVSFEDSFIKDYNGDGIIQLMAFGDSITRGTGDFIAVGEEIDFIEHPFPETEAGFPLRLETLLGVNAKNDGIPGDRIVERGVNRFASLAPHSGADIFLIQGGSNDATFQENSTDYARAIQKMINIATVSGGEAVLIAIPLKCCNRSGLNLFANEFNLKLQDLARVNNMPFVDTYKAFTNTCVDDECELLNLPEGLHPNIEGYDVMGEAIIASLYGINIFAVDGPTLLAQALNIAPESIRTKPDPVVAKTN